MSICPLEFRYGTPRMKAIFSEERRLQRLLDVEAALSKAQEKVGNIPPPAAENIAKNANVRTVTVNRVKEIEAEIGHDVMAMVTALSEKCSKEAARYVHLGATSSDILDSATALQLKEAVSLIEEDLAQLLKVFTNLAKEHRNTLMIGRTHGQAAIPITFGLKMAVYALETKRHVERLAELKKRVFVGKMSGAVGTGAAFGPKAPDIQRISMELLGLGYEEASGQIVGRDRYAELVAVLANICSSADKFATEVRNLQRSEIGELAESFGREKQVGSSTMSHKQNPVMSENICGLARVVRGMLAPAFEDVSYWHERDITQSSTERFLIPHSLILTDDILTKTVNLFSNIRVFPERMKENIERSNGLVMAESVMIALVGKGMGRQEAHKLTRESAMQAREKGAHLREILRQNATVTKLMTAKDLDAALDPSKYTGMSSNIIDDVIDKCT